jgi:hypothetical protein
MTCFHAGFVGVGLRLYLVQSDLRAPAVRSTGMYRLNFLSASVRAWSAHSWARLQLQSALSTGGSVRQLAVGVCALLDTE